jgi:hypothetical protein
VCCVDQVDVASARNALQRAKEQHESDANSLREAQKTEQAAKASAGDAEQALLVVQDSLEDSERALQQLAVQLIALLGGQLGQASGGDNNKNQIDIETAALEDDVTVRNGEAGSTCRGRACQDSSLLGGPLGDVLGGRDELMETGDVLKQAVEEARNVDGPSSTSCVDETRDRRRRLGMLCS